MALFHNKLSGQVRVVLMDVFSDFVEAAKRSANSLKRHILHRQRSLRRRMQVARHQPL